MAKKTQITYFEGKIEPARREASKQPVRSSSEAGALYQDLIRGLKIIPGAVIEQ